VCDVITQVHDFWHVLAGLPPTVMGELALKWFELVQTGLPLCAFSGVFGPIILSKGEVITTTLFDLSTSSLQLQSETHRGTTTTICAALHCDGG